MIFNFSLLLYIHYISLKMCDIIGIIDKTYTQSRSMKYEEKSNMIDDLFDVHSSSVICCM